MLTALRRSGRAQSASQQVEERVVGVRLLLVERISLYFHPRVGAHGHRAAVGEAELAITLGLRGKGIASIDFRSARQNTRCAVRPLRGQRAAQMHDLPDAVRERRAAE